jgi:hypothetical protein
MFLNIKTGYAGITKRDNSEIVILVSSLHTLVAQQIPFVFTNYHAYTAQDDEFFNSVAQLDRINWPLIKSRDFRNDPENPRKSGEYQAEALVHRVLPIVALTGIACYNDQVQDRLTQAAQTAGVQTPIKVLRDWYF